MQLYILFAGNSKKRMRPIMIDELHKCENYRDQRTRSGGVERWHDIKPADKDAVIWRRKSCTVGGNKCESVGRVGKGPAGWIGKDGFNVHT